MSKEFIKKGTTKKHLKHLFLLAFIITGILVVSSLGGADVSADDSAVYQVTIDKELVKFNDDLGFPKLINQRTLVPLRVISENMGYDVSWNQENQTATIENSKTKVSIKVASSVATVNGKEVILDTSAMLINTGSKGARTYVPLRFVSEALGAKVSYENVEDVHSVSIAVSKTEEEKEADERFINKGYRLDADKAPKKNISQTNISKTAIEKMSYKDKELITEPKDVIEVQTNQLPVKHGDLIIKAIKIVPHEETFFAGKWHGNDLIVFDAELLEDKDSIGHYYSMLLDKDGNDLTGSNNSANNIQYGDDFRQVYPNIPIQNPSTFHLPMGKGDVSLVYIIDKGLIDKATHIAFFKKDFEFHAKDFTGTFDVLEMPLK